ncbi:MAG: glycoside hydrolase family 9 protein [Ruminococcus sp.]|nr:glycoside hydrolase family 9 protein [Ruminococcus sp.]
MKTKFTSRLVSVAASTAVLLSATVLPMPSALTAQAMTGGNLIYNDFETNNALPWHYVVTPPAKLERLESDKGELDIKILNNGGQDVGGESRWDCQLRHRKLKFRAGDQYTLHAEVRSDTDGEIYTRISDLKRDVEIWHNGVGKGEAEFDQNWACMPLKANEKLTIDSTWTCAADLDDAEWAWEFGGAGDYQDVDCFPEGTVLHFDNLMLNNDTRDDDGYVSYSRFKPDIVINNEGYQADAPKTATYTTAYPDNVPSTIYLISADNEVKKEIKLKKPVYDEMAGTYATVIDFSDFTKEGEYYFAVKKDDGTYKRISYEFMIQDDVYHDIAKSALNYFYQNRANTDIKPDYIADKGDNTIENTLAHVGIAEKAYVLSDWPKYNYKPTKNDKEISINGGWYTGSDRIKSTTDGAYSAWMLQNLYEFSQLSENGKKAVADKSGRMLIPENGNDIPDLLDEARYELEFLFDMQIDEEDGYEMTLPKNYEDVDPSVYVGMVHSSVKDNQFVGVSKNWDYIDEYDAVGLVTPPSTEATYAFAAVCAQAARLWKDYDEDFAGKCLSKAQHAFDAASAAPMLYIENSDVIYTNSNTRDAGAENAKIWAATELAITTNSPAYLTTDDVIWEAISFHDAVETEYDEADASANSVEELGAFGADNTYALSALSLIVHPDILGEYSSAPSKNLVAAADDILKAQSANSFGMPVEAHKYTQTLHNGKVEADIIGFNYGSNADVVSNAIILAYASADSKDDKYINGAYQAVEYLMGRNPLANSYVTGTNGGHTCYPYHRYWAHGLDEEFPYPPAGVLVSGPNNMEYLDSEYMMMSGYTFDRDLIAPMQFYLDDNECYNVNEVSAPINASFAWLMNVLANNVDDNTAEVLDPEFSIDWTKRGDINGDSEINISDAIYLSRYSAEDANLESTGIQAVKEQMDVNDDGKINGEDVVLILRRISWGDKFDTYGKN